MDAPAKAKAKAKAKTQADAAFAKAINRAVVAKTVAYGKAGFPAPPPLENACGLCGTPPAAQAAAAPAAGAFAAHAMAAPPARTWREIITWSLIRGLRSSIRPSSRRGLL
eukprot:GEMP01051467.1.p3 GENE.GEMP01051467.1~~GEMP01051467.1.p3  ORF type:complete len:110 (+),score=35.54 GEMP01051467.1:108-437(+)